MKDYFSIVDILWPKMEVKLSERKLSKVVKTPCWIMQGRISYKDYHSVWHEYVAYSVHIVSLVRKLGRNISLDMTCDHLCFVKPCFNPEHLEEISREENGRRAGLRYGNGRTKRKEKFDDPGLSFRYAKPYGF